MFRRTNLSLIPLLVLFALGQFTVPFVRENATSAPSVTPSLINFSGMPSTEGTALGPQTFTGTGNCPTNSYCVTWADPSLAGTTLIVPYTYTEGTADTPTIASYTGNPSSGYTATGDTWAHCGADALIGTTYVGCYFTIGATTGTIRAVLTWTNGPTNVAAGAYQGVNAHTFDAYNKNTGTASTAWTTGSVSPAVANDWIISCAVGTTTRTNVAAFSAPTYTADLNDRRDAQFCQSGVDTGTGATNPAVTSGTSNNYAGFTLAFAAGAQGTAPSGMYIAHLYHVSSATGISTDLAYSFPAIGNLLAVTISGGGAVSPPMEITAVSDSTNGSWSSCVPRYPGAWGVPNVNNFTSMSGYYKANATSGDLAVTLTHSNTGDTGPATFYDVVGASTVQSCGWQQTIQLANASAATTYTSNTGFAPASSAGLAILWGSVNINTCLGATVGTQDLYTVGGQSVAGPSIPDENNCGSHFYFSANTPNDIKWSWLDPTSGSNGFYGAMTFQAPSATVYPQVMQYAVNHATASGTSLTVTNFVPTAAGDTLVVLTNVFNITTGTFGCSDPTNGTYTTVKSATNATNGPWRGASFIKSNIAATTVTITCTFGTSNTQRGMFVFEIQGNRSVDQSIALTNVTSGTGGVVTQGVTTTHANEVILQMGLCAIVCDGWTATNTSPAMQPYTQPGLGDSFGDSAVFLQTGATGTFAAGGVADSGGSGEAEAVETVTVF